MPECCESQVVGGYLLFVTEVMSCVSVCLDLHRAGTLLRRPQFQVALVVKNLPANVGDLRDTGLIPASGKSPGGGHGNALQYSCLENPMNRGAWWAAVHGVTKSQT